MALAILAGGTSGLIASLMGGATHWLHVTLFGSGAEYGLSALRKAAPFVGDRQRTARLHTNGLMADQGRSLR